MTESRRLLRHFLAALAYRTQKALRDAPPAFADYRAAPAARTPFELLWHMTGLIGYARTMFHGGDYAPPRLADLPAEVGRFHAQLEALDRDFADATLEARISDQQFLHGPLADAMTHVGQLALLRRLFGEPVPPENFIFATIDAANLGERQALPNAPDPGWSPGQMPRPPAPLRENRVETAMKSANATELALMTAAVVGAADPEIVALEVRLRSAQLAADVPALDRLISDDLLFTGPNGQLGTKAEDLAAHGSGAVRFRAHVPEELRVRRVGPDVALCALRARLEVEVGGMLVAGTYRYTRVWAREPDGAWRVAGGHVSPVP
jgi:ketosteroid isomerase-like protein